LNLARFTTIKMLGPAKLIGLNLIDGNTMKALIYCLMLALASGFAITAQANEVDTHLTGAKRVVLVHGWARNSLSMWRLAAKLEDAGYDVVSLDYSSINRDIDDIQAQVREQMYACCNDDIATHYVGYSLGGLLIRGFFADEANAEFAPHRARVVMIGTPNNGTQIVDRFADKTWFKWLGEASLSLGTDANSFPMGLPLPDFRAGIIAGTDGYSELTDEIIGEPNDGTVPVESTKLPNMADFFAIYANHSMLRYDSEVARQTIYFLQHGKFDHPTKLASCASHSGCSPATM
jgi:pimeloyl-ACP methyl ester carboxylesterase